MTTEPLTDVIWRLKRFAHSGLDSPVYSKEVLRQDVDRILADHKQAIAAAEEATVEAAATICDEFRVVHETNCDAADDEMDADIEHGLYMAAKELTVKIRALAHTSILANREAEIRRQARLKEAEWWADHDVEDYDLQSQWDEMCRERLAELTAPPTTGTAASDT